MRAALPRASEWGSASRLRDVASELRALRRHDTEIRNANLSSARVRMEDALLSLRFEKASPKTFNLFRVLRLSRREYVHSNVLSWLCDPFGNHGLGSAFLNKALAEAKLPTTSSKDLPFVRVRREHVGDSSIVDITVSTPEAFLVIENKVDAEEGVEQTAREYSDFKPKAEGRAFAAVFLSPNGEKAARKGFAAWSYEIVWRWLNDITGEGSLGAFLKDYRDIVKAEILEGKIMAKLKSLRPETKFVLEHWEDVQLLQEAMAAAEADFAQLLGSAVASLADREWWDEEQWRGELEGKKGFYLFKKSWEIGDSMYCLGMYDFGLDAILSGKRAWSYVYLPASARTPANIAKITKAAKAINLATEDTRSEKYPFWRSVRFDGMGSDLERIQDRIMAEMDALSGLARCLDELAASKSVK